MTAQAVMEAGRVAAERLMVDTCTVKHQTGETMDPVTLQMTPTYTTLYTGKCRVQLTATVALMPEAGERVIATQRVTVQLPTTVTGVQVDDIVQVTAAAHDGDLVGRVYRVRSEFAKTHATARRLECEESQT